MADADGLRVLAVLIIALIVGGVVVSLVMTLTGAGEPLP